ncbi:RNA polymerase II transcription factor SIII subunit A-domain-containing protein [Penicillium argentinense]|uniref:RNA polymerase II transcription factor SIII subunit A-domain-containing protein n=1 Tax=Penicillium argentinense TaxID=1131581 RepID=A0A9W9KF90_9EURO|nr:RNA polymerase II transcription factor SIII subunit A-domain-containing protein [Penicillium argentinense]KAJ5102962.1 RNA polymerase II transcription factor SIII subunit A-domain-containing protein [Penicillium argentinense]
MPARSLLKMVTAVAVKNYRDINDIGDVPYHIARPILVKVESPVELRRFEAQSPQIIGLDKELWINFIKRDVEQWETRKIPEESDDWGKVYDDLCSEVAAEVEKDAERLVGISDKLKAAKERFLPKLIPMREGKPRRTLMAWKNCGGKPPRGMFPQRTKTTIFNEHPRRNKALETPFGKMSSRASQVTQAPQSMINAYRSKTSAPASRETARYANASLRTSSMAPAPKHATASSPEPASASSRKYSSSSADLETARYANASLRGSPVAPAPKHATASSPEPAIASTRKSSTSSADLETARHANASLCASSVAPAPKYATASSPNSTTASSRKSSTSSADLETARYANASLRTCPVAPVPKFATVSTPKPATAPTAKTATKVPTASPQKSVLDPAAAPVPKPSVKSAPVFFSRPPSKPGTTSAPKPAPKPAAVSPAKPTPEPATSAPQGNNQNKPKPAPAGTRGPFLVRKRKEPSIFIQPKRRRTG